MSNSKHHAICKNSWIFLLCSVCFDFIENCLEILRKRTNYHYFNIEFNYFYQLFIAGKCGNEKLKTKLIIRIFLKWKLFILLSILLLDSVYFTLHIFIIYLFSFQLLSLIRNSFWLSSAIFVFFSSMELQQSIMLFIQSQFLQMYPLSLFMHNGMQKYFSSFHFMEVWWYFEYRCFTFSSVSS